MPNTSTILVDARIILKRGINEKTKSSLGRATIFGIFVFGSTWMIYTLFIPIVVFPEMLIDVIIRVGIDIISVFLSVLIIEKV